MIKRRTFLGSLSAGAALTGCSSDDEAPPLAATNPVFAHGVASGDPRPSGVVLWTRVTRMETAGPIPVAVRVFADVGLTELVFEADLTTDRDRDDTVKVEADGLIPASTYYFEFEALGMRSPIGRTRTAPEASARLRFALASCSNYDHGYFNAYRRIAERADLDLVIHLGDYIYEYEPGRYGTVRTSEPPREIVTLDDYRQRYAHYRRDPDLAECHRQHPFVTVWDDHESANDAFRDGAENHDADEGTWIERSAAARQAYFEWMPIRDNEAREVQRVVRYGELVDLIMLDTRLCCRDEQASNIDRDPLLEDESRSLLGEDQEAWLTEQMVNSTATWKLLGQQVMLGQSNILPNPDQWDGYPFARQRLFDSIRDNAVSNVVVLTGDIHSSWGHDLTDDPYDVNVYNPETGEGSVAVEVITPAITSPGFPDALASLSEGAMADNPHLKYADVNRRGYVVLDITPERLQSAWWFVDTIEAVSEVQSSGGVLQVLAGTPRLVTDDAPAASVEGAPPFAP
ncbi:MAG: alkaline phosphatase D family protein [Myxococcota bacterium]